MKGNSEMGSLIVVSRMDISYSGDAFMTKNDETNQKMIINHKINYDCCTGGSSV